MAILKVDMLAVVDSPFDAFAWFYDRYWSAPFESWQRSALEQVFFPHVPHGARILDLCCGTGTLARELVLRGYNVTGIDSSIGMLRIAREHVPEGTFLHADAADFSLDPPVAGAICVFDSLNHLLDASSFRKALDNVYAALVPGGCFVFDTNTSAAYGERWDDQFCEVQADHAFFLRGGFDRETRIGHTKVTMFRLFDTWQRSDVEMRQRPWEVSELKEMLYAAGFRDLSAFNALEDLHMAGHYGIGRAYLQAFRPHA